MLLTTFLLLLFFCVCFGFQCLIGFCLAQEGRAWYKARKFATFEFDFFEAKCLKVLPIVGWKESRGWFCNHRQKSWDTFVFLGRFPIHAGPTPPLTPQTILDVLIQNFFSVSTLCRVGGGRTGRKFRKECTVLRGNREMAQKYEYCCTVPRTFVQDYSSEWGRFLTLTVIPILLQYSKKVCLCFQIVETSVTVPNNLVQNYNHLDGHI